MSHDPSAHRPKRPLEHAPTVIHHPEEDQTLLYRWMKRTLEKGPIVWVVAATVIAVSCLLAIILNSAMSGQSKTAKAWSELITAGKADDYIKTAEQLSETTPGIPAGWALLQAAEMRYQESFNDLPANRDAALPLLSKARDLFQRASDMAGKDDQLKRYAEMGLARVLEARGELDEAVKQYKKIALTWPDSPEGKHASELADALSKPEAVAFYQQFSTFKPAEAKLPTGLPSGLDLSPGGKGSLTIPELPPLGGMSPDTPPAPTLPPSPEPAPVIEMPKVTPPKATEAPAPAEAPKTEAPKTEEMPKPEPPKAAETPKAEGELPGQPFAEPKAAEAPKPADELPSQPFSGDTAKP